MNDVVLAVLSGMLRLKVHSVISAPCTARNVRLCRGVGKGGAKGAVAPLLL